jgi:hypothetical protein
MAKKPQTRKEQPDTEDELLNFDLEELFGNEAPAEDEVIELVELIEVDKDEDRTRELAVKSRQPRQPKQPKRPKRFLSTKQRLPCRERPYLKMKRKQIWICRT